MNKNEFYNKDTIDTMFANICESLERIEKQTVATNGRVRSLEKWKIGLMTAISTLAAMNIPNASTLLKAITAIMGA